MNGDIGKVYNKLIEIQTKQEERHIENKGDLKTLFTLNKEVSDKVYNLPCKTHEERMSGIKVAIVAAFSCITGITGVIILIHLGG